MHTPQISPHKKIIAFGFILFMSLVVTLFFACDDGGNETIDDGSYKSNNRGAFTLAITWPENTPMSLEGIDCSASGITTIIGKMYDANGVLQGSAEFDCGLHRGTLDNLQPGSNRTVVVTGLDDENNEVYQGVETGILIVQGGITHSKGILMAVVGDNVPAGSGCTLRGDQGDYTNYFGMSFKLIVEEGLPVTFTMGSPTSEVGRKDDETEHGVGLEQPFYIQTTEVTQCQWEEVIEKAETAGELTSGSLDKNPSRQENCPDCPVEEVYWNDIEKWIAALNKISDDTYALPTEAQWEYACRAGNYRYGNPFTFGECLASTDQANYNGNSPYNNCLDEGEYRGETIKVASLEKNDWGLYDMHGNVYEWVQDGYADYPITLETDYVGSGEAHVLRGGSWAQSASFCRSAYRCRYDQPFIWLGVIGFRLVLLPDQ